MTTRWTAARSLPASASYPQGAMHSPASSASGPKVRITLTAAAQNQVLRNGLGPRLAVLMEQAPRMHTAFASGDRVALSETPGQDLYVLRRRIVVDAREAALEIILDFMPIG